MTFSLSEFLGVVNSVNGLTKSNKFRVIIIPRVDIGDIRTISFMCDQATLPGITWSTTDVRYTGYGNFVKRPTNATFTDVTLGFFVDNDSNVMSFFHQWMAKINHFDKSNAGTMNGLPIYQFSYPEEYFATVIIQVFDEEENITTEIKLTDAFPTSVNDQQLSWADQSNLLKLTVTMAYDSWNSNHFENRNTSNQETVSRNDYTEAPISRRQTGRSTTIE